MIEAILPEGVSAAECFGDLPGEPLFPEEEAVIARAVAKRRDEFRTVRGCARIALARLGADRPPLVPGERGAPAWPAGIVGSMTHCAGYRAAAVAPSSVLASLGVDAEPHGALPDGVLGAVARPAETAHLAALAGTCPGVHWDRLLFSAKESVYKAWYPLTGRWLGFEDAEVTFTPDGTFTASLLVPGPEAGGIPLRVLRGRWIADARVLVTAVTV